MFVELVPVPVLPAAGVPPSISPPPSMLVDNPPTDEALTAAVLAIVPLSVR